MFVTVLLPQTAPGPTLHGWHVIPELTRQAELSLCTRVPCALPLPSYR